MSRRRHRWHDDRLGSMLRRGMTDLRTAEPSDAVWRRIDAAIEPEPRRFDVRRLAQRIAPDSSGGHAGTGLLPWLALPGAAVLGVMFMISVAFHTADTSPWHGSTYPSAPLSENRPVSFGMTEPEFAMQPEMDQRIVGVVLPPGPREREAPPPRPAVDPADIGTRAVSDVPRPH